MNNADRPADEAIINNIENALESLKCAMEGSRLLGTEFRDDNGLDALNPAPQQAMLHIEDARACLEELLEALSQEDKAND